MTRFPNKWTAGCVIVSLFVGCLAGASGQKARVAKPSQELLRRLPEDWRTVVSSLEITEDRQREYLQLSDAKLQYGLLRALMHSPAAADFVLDHLESVQSLDDEIDLLEFMSEFDHWAKNPRAIGVLNKLTESHRDPQLVMAAFRSLIVLQTHRERLFVEQQLDNAEGRSREELAIQDEYLMDAEKSAVIPAYLRRSPSVFAAIPAKSSLRVLAFGDFGTGGPEQRQVAAAMLQYHKQHAFDFGITLGDNFYPIGMASPQDLRWQSQWEALYGPMKIRFYPSFGNHDWSSPDSPAAELSYHSKADDWIMPSSYYTYTAGPAQFFAIDTGTEGAMSLAQLQWLKAELDKSRTRWKIVYGHHCPYFARGAGEDSLLAEELMPILKGRADVYIAGHFHSLQHLKPIDGVNFYISAGGGRTLVPVDATSPQALFAKSVYGFSVIEIDDHSFMLKFIGQDGQVLDQSSIQK